MRQPIYILSACTISPQHTYEEVQFPGEPVCTESGKLYVADPDYTKYISPVAIRRMSRMLKRGITAGMRALDDAGIKTPDAIIAGTARGSVTDMEVFLKEMINLEEQALNPAGFIQSTYNSINGWLAMLSKCTGYNQAYVHRGFSLELCLLDAQLTLAEATGPKKVLAGAFDELTEEYYTIREKIGYYKQTIPGNLELFQHSDTPGSIAGEGAHFFVLSNEAGNAAAAILDVAMMLKPEADEMLDVLNKLLAENEVGPGDLDVLVFGMNGDSRSAYLTEPLLSFTGEQTTVATFKHLCGEYDTAAGFGLWLANHIIKQQDVPEICVYRRGSNNGIKNVLVCNVTINANVTFVLLKSCT